MASWTVPYRPETYERDSSFCWQEFEGLSRDESSDFFGQFVDFDNDMASAGVGSSSAGVDDPFHSAVMPTFTDPFLTDHPGSASSGVSSADEFDFLSSSSQVGGAPLGGSASTASQHDIDPKSLNGVAVKQETHETQNNNFHPAHESISDTELARLEGISLDSPNKKTVSASHPSSPTPPNTVGRGGRPSKIVEALSSTIRKATMRKGRKPIPEQQRPASPTQESPLKVTKQRRGRAKAQAPTQAQLSPQSKQPQSQELGEAGFIHGYCDDPFKEAPQMHHGAHDQHMRFFSAPLDSPGVRGDQPGVTTMAPGMWQQAAAESWAPNGGQEFIPDHWDPQMMAHHQQQQRNAAAVLEAAQGHAQMNMAIHAQQGELPYEYHHQQHAQHLVDPSSAGLMIQMPQGHPGTGHDIGLTAATYLPPPPPPMPASEPRARPPKARSSGTRHMSMSPMRRSRAPSASPTSHGAGTHTPGGDGSRKGSGSGRGHSRSRHSSGGSISSIRSNASANGATRLPGSMPGTPCSVRKRRSRDTSASGAAANAAAMGFVNANQGGMGTGMPPGGGSGGGIGFVNFTPTDGGMLMTGVAPSGSSKTKARREKEAQDRRRKLSEAAMKAVAAAGGDVSKFMEEGFVF